MSSAFRRLFSPRYLIVGPTVEGAHAWPIAMTLLAPYIRTTVIKDLAWEEREGDRVVRNVPIGEGMVDFETYFNLVRTLGISGPISVHFEYELPEDGEFVRRRRETASLMSRDLERVRGYLRDAGLQSRSARLPPQPDLS